QHALRPAPCLLPVAALLPELPQRPLHLRTGLRLPLLALIPAQRRAQVSVLPFEPSQRRRALSPLRHICQVGLLRQRQEPARMPLLTHPAPLRCPLLPAVLSNRLQHSEAHLPLLLLRHDQRTLTQLLECLQSGQGAAF